MTYLGSGDAARSLTDYYPSWLDNLADDVTIEGSAMDGVAQGPEAVRTILVAIRTLYEHQEFNFVGPVGDNGLLEDYTAQVRGESISCVVLVTRNAAGQTQHIVANYRPRSSLLLLSRLVGEKLADTPYAEHFAASESRNGSTHDRQHPAAMAHAIPTRQVLTSLEPITADNRRIISQEWLAEAFTMWGTAATVIAATAAPGRSGHAGVPMGHNGEAAIMAGRPI